ncbi:MULTISPECIES: hypothetical protein [unclassified Acinetobacter]|uniref:hypothetical protein n=1 Tax=unclassified Acinetobacter TaxID=196816 RepID=UPI0035B6B736
MKKILFILTKSERSHLNVNESINALLLMASYDLQVSVLFQDAALSLLAQPVQRNVSPDRDFLKSAVKMVAGFEFYDIENLYVLSQDQHNHLIKSSPYHIQAIDFNQQFISEYDHIICF